MGGRLPVGQIERAIAIIVGGSGESGARAEVPGGGGGAVGLASVPGCGRRAVHDGLVDAIAVVITGYDDVVRGAQLERHPRAGNARRRGEGPSAAAGLVESQLETGAGL